MGKYNRRIAVLVDLGLRRLDLGKERFDIFNAHKGGKL